MCGNSKALIKYLPLNLTTPYFILTLTSTFHFILLGDCRLRMIEEGVIAKLLPLLNHPVSDEVSHEARKLLMYLK